MRRRVAWTPLMDEYLLTNRLKGESFPALAARLGVSRRGAAARFALKFPDVAQPQAIRRVKAHGPETKDAVIRMRLAGKRLKEIAAELNLNVNQVHGIWWQWNNFLFIRERVA